MVFFFRVGFPAAQRGLQHLHTPPMSPGILNPPRLASKIQAGGVGKGKSCSRVGAAPLNPKTPPNQDLGAPRGFILPWGTESGGKSRVFPNLWGFCLKSESWGWSGRAGGERRSSSSPQKKFRCGINNDSRGDKEFPSRFFFTAREGENLSQEQQKSRGRARTVLKTRIEKEALKGEFKGHKDKPSPGRVLDPRGILEVPGRAEPVAAAPRAPRARTFGLSTFFGVV